MASDSDDAFAQELFAVAENLEAEPQGLEAPADEETTEKLPADSGEIAGEPALLELSDEEQPAQAETPLPADVLPEEEAGSNTGDETEDSRLDEPESKVGSSTEDDAGATLAEPGSPDSGEQEMLEAQTLDFEVMAAGPDGASAPYLYWNVQDVEGNLVGGATFEFERRERYRDGWGRWQERWTDSRNVVDCVSGNCTGYDRDVDPGEYLLKWIGSGNPGPNPGGATVEADARYRIRAVSAPDGYHWVSSTDWVDSNDRSWAGTGNNRTLDFGDFIVAQNNPTPVPFCTPGYVYGVSGNGQLQQIAPQGGVTPLGSAASGTSSFNGLGIGSDGEPVFAYERTNDAQTVTMYEFNTQTGSWVSTGDTYDTTLPANGSYSGALVAGAVNLLNDKYMFGGFQTIRAGQGTWNDPYRYSQVFKIWEYNPGVNPRFTYKGYVNTRASSTSEPGAANGDMAFDAAGNLFIVRGSGTTTTVFSVDADDLAAASNGSQIAASGSNQFTTMENVNGVAFDASGKAYLGSQTQIRSYDMPNWSNATTVVSSGYSGTDLATCSSPPTITIEKEVIGGRVNPSDQFLMTLNQGSTVLGTATTTGTTTGVQSERIGPLPTVRNVELTFNEVGANGADLSNYSSAYQCTVTHMDGTVQNLNQVNGTSGSITIPTSGEEVRCVFRNSPLIANVTVHKDVTDADGENPQPAEGWTVGATATATFGSVTRSPAEDTQPTDAWGDASWTLSFGSFNDRATVMVSEEMQDDYRFHSGQCTVTKLDGSQSTVTLSGPEATPLSDIAPGDDVQCTYVNQLLPEPVLTLEKIVENPDSGIGYAEADQWMLSATGPTSISGITGSDNVTAQTVSVGTYSLTEQFAGSEATGAGYDWTDLVCVDANQLELEVDLASADGIVTGATVELEREMDVTCSFTNTPRPGNVSWSKVDAVTDDLLAGSEWELSGPGLDEPLLIVDCEAAECAGPDVDPVAGAFTIENLVWGVYTLTETKAPKGYSPIEDQITFTIDGASSAAEFELGDIENERIPGTVAWAKADPNGQRLAGSKWELTGPIVGDEGESIEVEDCVAASTEECTGADRNPDAGEFLIEGLEWGDYTLVETSAPAGYVLDTTPRHFTISPETGLDFEFEVAFENVPRQMPVLPLTGGLGRDFFIIVGMSVLTLGLGALMAVQYRRRREGVA